MISSWIESLLPGTRSLRPPLISGLLWSLLIWIIYIESVSEPHEAATNWAGHAFIFIGEVGPLPVIIVISVLIWVIGVMSMTFTQTLAKAIAPVVLTFKHWFAWKIHAYKSAQKLQQKHSKLQADYEKKGNDNSPSSNEQLQKIKNEIDKHQQKIDQVRNSTILGIYIPRTTSMLRILGKLPQYDRTHDISYNIVNGVAQKAVDDAIQNDSIKVSASSINVSTSEFVYAFEEEFEPDPLDALRGLDEKLYLELDRERSEREVRLGISTPLLAFGIVGWLIWNNWFLVFILFGIMLLVKGALVQSIERSRVINLVGLKGLQTPALRLAAAAGRDQLRKFLSEKQQESNKQ